ncbi:MAG: helix-turn-helix domain-containing protein [Bacteroidota bacterium]
MEVLDYALDGTPFQVLGAHEHFWVWQYGKRCVSYRRESENAPHQAQVLALQEDRLSAFALLCYHPEKKEIWIRKGDTTYLINRQEEVRYAFPQTARCVALDRDDNYWFGQYEVDLLRLQKQRFRRLLQKDQARAPHDKSHQCRGIFERSGQVYVGTYQGVRRIDLAGGEVSSLPTGKEALFCLLEDQKKRFWLAHNDLIQLDPTQQRVVQRLEIPSRTWSIFEDRNKQLWLGNERGLCFLRDGRIQPLEQYNEFTNLAKALVLFFFEDRAGQVWIGSNDGLYQLDLSKGITAGYGRRQSAPQQLPAQNFQHMYQDADGSYWLATGDAGLLHWNPNTKALTQYDKKWGMLTDNTYSVYEDDFSYLWMSSFNGLIRFHKATETVQFFHEEDGITYDEFNRISHYQAEDGQLFFGSQNGITALQPRDFLVDHTQGPEFRLRVEHISVIGKNISRDYWADGSPIDLTALPASTSSIDLELRGSNSFWSGNVALHHALERLDGRAPLSSREKVTYNHHIELFEMLPGRYRLRVRATQKNGKQLGEELEIALYIRPPIYQTTWFWALVLPLLLLGIVGFIRWRTARLEAQKVALEALVTERTSQILKKQRTIDNQVQLIESMKTLLSEREEAWLERFRSIVLERLSDPGLYLPDIIKEMDISRTAFYEKVKSLTHMTPNQYIQELRLRRAKELLEGGQVGTVKEVAQAVGIKEAKYFSKRFKERYGILPSAYLRELGD